jgi:hypothetical protein
MTGRCILEGFEDVDDTMELEEARKKQEEAQIEVLRSICNKVFSTNDGKIVLDMLLHDLFIFEQCHDDDDKALNQYGKYFLRERLGLTKVKDVVDFIAQTAASERGNK